MIAEGYPSQADYLGILSQFPRYAERGVKRMSDDAHREYFADPVNDEDGLRTMGNYVFVCSLLASDPGYDAAVGGVGAAHLLRRARSGLDYMTRGHHTGAGTCANGGKWGGNWQASWWAAKMAAGAALIWDRLSPEEQAAVERVVAAEADRHLLRRANSGLFVDTKAEENAWDTEILAMAVTMFAGHANAAAWRAKLIEFSVNALSVPQDRWADALVDGRPLREQVYTTNVHADFTLENHGAYHFCYVASPLQSIAWGFYAFLRAGVPVPEAHGHHMRDLWERAKPTFLDNRFAYVSGKEWARYTYGLYFIVPALAMIQIRFGDGDARAIEAARVERLAFEQRANDDGSFFGRRVTRNRFFGQWAKYETDCYANLGLAYLLHKHAGSRLQHVDRAQLLRNIRGCHVSPESGLCFARTERSFASFSWRTLETATPIALFVPNGMDDATEWQPGNLLGQVHVAGVSHALLNQSMVRQGDGFVVDGTVMYWGRGGERLHHTIHVAFDTDTDTLTIDSTFIAKQRLWIHASQGLALHVANDVFNSFERRLQSDLGTTVVRWAAEDLCRPLSRAERVRRKMDRVFDVDTQHVPCGRRWVNVDDKLGIVARDAAPGFWVTRSPHTSAHDSLHYDVITSPRRRRWYRVEAGAVILQTRVLLVAGTAEDTRDVAATVSAAAPV